MLCKLPLLYQNTQLGIDIYIIIIYTLTRKVNIKKYNGLH